MFTFNTDIPGPQEVCHSGSPSQSDHRGHAVDLPPAGTAETDGGLDRRSLSKQTAALLWSPERRSGMEARSTGWSLGFSPSWDPG